MEQASASAQKLAAAEAARAQAMDVYLTLIVFVMTKAVSNRDVCFIKAV